MWNDVVYLLYLVELTGLWIISICFVDWARRQNWKSTWLYNWITLFFITSILYLEIGAIGRGLRICDFDAYLNFTESKTWIICILPNLFVVIGMSIHMLVRLIRFRYPKASHYLNPLHIYCRLRDKKVGKNVAKFITEVYEKTIYGDNHDRRNIR